MVKSYCVKQKNQTECVPKRQKMEGLCLNANALNVESLRLNL